MRHGPVHQTVPWPAQGVVLSICTCKGMGLLPKLLGGQEGRRKTAMLPKPLIQCSSLCHFLLSIFCLTPFYIMWIGKRHCPPFCWAQFMHSYCCREGNLSWCHASVLKRTARNWSHVLLPPARAWQNCLAGHEGPANLLLWGFRSVMGRSVWSYRDLWKAFFFPPLFFFFDRERSLFCRTSKITVL